MSTGQKAFWIIIIVLIVVGGYWWWSSSHSIATTDTNSSVSTSGTSGQTGTGVSVSTGASSNTVPMTATVVFNGSTFSPANVTIAQGGTVTWTSTASSIWIASDPYPIHNGYDGTTMQQHCASGYAGATPFDQCSSGSTYSFTFNKVGTWGYDDQLDGSIAGSVTVVAQ